MYPVTNAENYSILRQMDVGTTTRYLLRQPVDEVVTINRVLTTLKDNEAIEKLEYKQAKAQIFDLLVAQGFYRRKAAGRYQRTQKPGDEFIPVKVLISRSDHVSL
ncbi:hypothetical protein [uncultured Umboniibacter sp.]|uniref:hypothetical protein n=1 Tax=uncultured Umboniibacter sp. TaxID=1798917 RepID=UPI0026385A81|nr:hypothetical protein [uncultured Umboniibacter sp.]